MSGPNGGIKKTVTVRLLPGSHRGDEPLDIDPLSIQVPDMWHIAMAARDAGDSHAADAILRCWHLAHDLKSHIVRNA